MDLRRVEGGHVVPRYAVVRAIRGTSGTLWIGQGAEVQGAILHGGAVVVGHGARIQGDVAAGHELVIGAHASVDGDLRATGRIVVQAHATARSIAAGADVLLLGPCQVGNVRAVGDILVAGEPRTGALTPGGRVFVRPW